MFRLAVNECRSINDSTDGREKDEDPLRDILTGPTTDPGSFAISPDGEQIVYAATVDGQERLWDLEEHGGPSSGTGLD